MMKKLLLTLMLLGLVSLIQAASSVHQWSEHSVLAEGRWLKVALSTTHDGIYQISYSQLKNWGFTHPERVGVYGYGAHVLSESLASNHLDDVPEMAVMHDTQRQRILFYGRGLTTWSYSGKSPYGFEHRNNTYSTQSYYFLHQKEEGDAPKSIEAPETAVPQNAADTLTSFDELWLYEKDNINIGESGREFYGESFLTTRSQRFVLPAATDAHLKGHTLLSDSVQITVNFVTYSNARSDVSIQVEGSKAGTLTVVPTTGSYVFGTEGTFNGWFTPASDLVNPTVTLTLSNSDSGLKLARLNYIRMQGKSPLTASDKEPFLLFRDSRAHSQSVYYSIGGMTDQMQVWDVTEATLAERQTVTPDHRGAGFTPQKRGIREYALVNLASSSFPNVSWVGEVMSQDLHGTPGANLVIVTAPAYLSQAQQLAAFRLEHDNLTSCIVTPEAIYNEYSSGVPDATAIRLFLKQMYDRQQRTSLPDTQQLRYLLLLGDGTPDNRRNSQSNFYLPTYESDASLVETSSCVCDDYFGFLDDEEGGHLDSNNRYTISDARLDIGIGRLPVHTADEATAVVQKIISYSSNRYYGPWKNRLVFLSDDDKMDNSGHDSPNLHIKHNEQLINSMQAAGHHEFVYQKLYLPAYQQITSASGTDYPDVRKEFNTALQQGTLLVNYAGHGAASSITHEALMDTEQAWNLRMKNLPLWVAASCDVCRWDATDTSMGEALLLNPNGGAAAVIGSSRVVYAQQNLRLNQAIVDHLFDRNADGTRFRLGDIIKAAKVALGAEYNKLNFLLLGDPSMVLSYPEQQIRIDGVEYGEQVTVTGRVLQTGTQQTDTLFHGLIYPTVYGAEDSIRADKGLWQEPYYTFATRTRKVFSGRDAVVGGRFSFRFTVPSDATSTFSNPGALGMINLYACSEERDEAQGFYRNFRISASQPAERDTLGPTLRALFLDSPSFQSGDEVGTTPFFYAEVYDASGFNTTGNRIGHDMTLSLRCLSDPLIRPQQFILNNLFTTFTGDATTGNVKYALSALAEGRYEATFRVWDAFNNATTHRFEFVVNAQAAPKVSVVQAYPSPARQGETVTFRVLHNRPESAERLRLQIYTQMGAKVLDKTLSSSSAEVVYLEEGATEPTQISSAMNADETSQLRGCTSTTWEATVPPGVYMYRVYLSSGSAEASSIAKKLIIR